MASNMVALIWHQYQPVRWSQDAILVDLCCRFLGTSGSIHTPGALNHSRKVITPQWCSGGLVSAVFKVNGGYGSARLWGGHVSQCCVTASQMDFFSELQFGFVLLAFTLRLFQRTKNGSFSICYIVCVWKGGARVRAQLGHSFGIWVPCLCACSTWSNDKRQESLPLIYTIFGLVVVCV